MKTIPHLLTVAVLLAAGASTLAQPIITNQPQSVTNLAGTTATLSIGAEGTPPLTYQWRKHGTNLAEGGDLSGATTANLTLNYLLHADAGAYSVVITNGFGSVTSAVATLTVIDPAINVQPASQVGNVGNPVTLSVGAAGTLPLIYQWRKDGVAQAGATESSLILTNLQGSGAGNYDVMVSNGWGTVTSTMALLSVNFAPPDAFNPGANGAVVLSLAAQVDGKILVGGSFNTLGGQSRNYLGRLNADGTLDSGFNPGADNGSVLCLALQADGKILVGGGFTKLGGQSRLGFGRLNADGTLDTTFAPGTDRGVVSLAVQADGRILAGGWFTMLGGESRNYLGRLNADGTLDSSFSPGAGGQVDSLALQADGKILVGGFFTTLGGQSRTNIGRFNADGTLDTSFNPGADVGVGSLAVQADGKILVGGYFRTLGGQSRNHIGRLNADGTLDSTFNPGADREVMSLAVQADGKVLMGGGFNTLGGQTRNYIGRLNIDGTVDASFNPGADNPVGPVAVQADGKILVGGLFSMLAGQGRAYIGRLENTGPAIQSLIFDGSALTWMRGGSSPEVWRTTFEYSPDGSSWANLGTGVRIPGGWQLSGLALPANSNFRARGYTVSGSASFVEDTIGSLVIYEQPTSLTNDPGTTAEFDVYAGGTGTLTYQWRKGSANLADGNDVSGSATARLILSSVLGGDAGTYSVVISNPSGSVTSSVATLVIMDPVINLQPTSQVVNAGDGVTLSVTASGTPPLDYQWRKDGAAEAGATQSSLTLTDLQESNTGSYDVVVRSSWGAVTSSLAALTVNLALPDAFAPQFAGQSQNGTVTSLALQADGKLLLGYSFWRGFPAGYVNRVNGDGTTDATFVPIEFPSPDGVFSYGSVNCLALQSDGKIIVAGTFVVPNGGNGASLARFNADGTLDSSFNSEMDLSFVNCLAIQADGKILAGGDFGIARLNPDGTADTTFSVPELNNNVDCIAVQADGKIVVGGQFSTLDGQYFLGIGRLNTDGAPDTSFRLGADYNTVSCLAVQADGKVLVAGVLAGQSRNLGRLNADGTLDASFNADPGADGDVNSLVLQADGRILAGGSFSTLRLNSDGTLDNSFDPVTDGNVTSLAVQADGKILVGGSFATLAGQSRTNIGRLNNTAPPTQSLTFDGSTLTWMRGGSSPEVWRTTFEYSPDGDISWVVLGAGTRIPGGWQLTGLALPTNAVFRVLPESSSLSRDVALC